jgi:hypothetical protein
MATVARMHAHDIEASAQEHISEEAPAVKIEQGNHTGDSYHTGQGSAKVIVCT